MNYTLSKKFKGGTPSSDGNEIGIGTGAAAFDILKDTRELSGMRISLFSEKLQKN
jgi:hypothetical protein